MKSIYKQKGVHMSKVTRNELKRKILSSFVKLIESKPELMNDLTIKDAYHDLKNKISES